MQPLSDGQPLAFNGIAFSDGRVLSYTIDEAPELTHPEYPEQDPTAFTFLYQAAVFSMQPIVLRLDTGFLPASLIPICSPVTAGKITNALRAHYGTRISSTQRDVILSNRHHKGGKQGKKCLNAGAQTYGDLKNDNIFYEGLIQVSDVPLTYRVRWGSWL